MTVWEFITGHVDGNYVQTGIAGTLGGAVRWMTLRSDWRTGLIGLVVGGISSLYLSPLVRPILGPLVGLLTYDPFQTANFSGFVVGISGITITGLIMDIIAARRRKVDADVRGDKDGE